MIQLTTNLSEPLLQLIHDDEAPIDAVEVGEWFTPQQIRDYRRMLPTLPFHFHGGNLISRVGLIPGTLSRIAAYVRFTESPWISMHITMWLPGMEYIREREALRDQLFQLRSILDSHNDSF